MSEISPETLAAAREFQHARHLLQTGRPREAAAVLGPLVGRQPGFGAAWSLLGSCHLSLGDPQAALTATERALGCDADHAYAWRVRGEALLALKRADEAAGAAEQLLAADPDGWRGHELLARALLATGRRDRAETGLAAAARAVELAPEEPGAHYTHGRVAFALARYPEADRSFGEVLRLDPDHANAHHALGVVRSRRDGRESLLLAPAAAGFADALAVRPDHALSRDRLEAVLWAVAAKARWFGLLCLVVTAVLAGVSGAHSVHPEGAGYRLAAAGVTAAVVAGWAWRVRSQLPDRSRGPLRAFAWRNRPVRWMAVAAALPVASSLFLAAAPDTGEAVSVIVLFGTLLAVPVLSAVSRSVSQQELGRRPPV
jgi:tetratricopeptide (TPR) repeat protein